MKVYFTFGQKHVHRVNGTTFDCDSIAVIEAESEEAARKRAFELFDDQWHQSLLSVDNILHYFPRGILPAEPSLSEQLNRMNEILDG